MADVVKALVVDDDEMIRGYLKEVLEAEGFLVLEAGNGREAIAILESSDTIRLIITDIIMPEVDGIGLILAARRLDRNKGLRSKIIAISGGGRFTSKDMTLEAAKTLGADAVLTKPFGEKNLRQILADLNISP